jgi:hypothetical protein
MTPRILDWENDRWECFEYEGVTWYKSELGAWEFKVLYTALAPQINKLFASKANEPVADSDESDIITRILTITPVPDTIVSSETMSIDDSLSVVVVPSPEPGTSTKLFYNDKDVLAWESDSWVHRHADDGTWVLRELSQTDYRVLYTLLAPVILKLLDDTRLAFTATEL